MNTSQSLKLTGGILLAGVAGFSLHAAAAEHDAWRTAIHAIKVAGFHHIEELETTTFGGFEAEVFDKAEQSFELQLDGKGVIVERRLEAKSSGEARFELALAPALLDWLETNGYREIESISADDGHIEVAAKDRSGKHLELDIEAGVSGFKLLRMERD